MKIIILSDDFPPNNLGGAGIIAFNLAKALLKMGHTMLVITTVQDRKMEGVAEYMGLKIYRLYSNYHERWRAYASLYNPQTVKKVQRIIEEFEPDIVHAHNIHSHLSYRCLKIAKQSGSGVFLTAHDVMLFHYGKLVEYIDPKDLSCPTRFNYKISPWQQIKRFKKRYNPLRNVIIRQYLKYVDKIFAVSNALKDALNQNGIENVEVIHNGIDVQEWQIKRETIDKIKQKYGLLGKRVVLFGGRISNAKGGLNVVKAMKEIQAESGNSILLILGKKDDYVEDLIKKSEREGFKEKIICTGWVEGGELKALYWSSDIIVVPSLCFDSFPNTNLEGMASLKPVISTCFGGTSEVVIDGVTGFVVNPYDIQNLAEKISKILNDYKLASAMGEAGYKRVKNDFSLEIQTNKILYWYNR
ncbi:MAG: hypothetical protein COX06_00755 [Candidatus Zambryskibacteria bacterium CG22_combo_CG10-13_8_21_14_all_42_17]|uniref:Glycosyl transferase n=1 Tax=Candidatus Zambryskibacteria bacterium CG22_combo_CG10-13_8_21_14_all_42_17 TaxID=1975118 RepID=A0A2H0BDZ6_9BACT|nr:MAG: hypothetical protein COX06_00755 [Candidatus Zambryskibacteria bacterium CG22_combo_CG10-13_8_21_14_all_42_17]